MKLPQFLPRLKKPKLFFVRRVVGDSMLPTLRSGSIIIAFRTRRVSVGDIIIITHNGLEKTKRVKQTNGDMIFIEGDNLTQSTDSRHFGWVDRAQMLGKVWRRHG